MEKKPKSNRISREAQLQNRTNWVENGQLYLQRCMQCDPVNGRENWAVAVATGRCAFCGWRDDDV